MRIVQGDKDKQEASPLREGKSQDTSKLVYTQTQINTHIDTLRFLINTSIHRYTHTHTHTHTHTLTYSCTFTINTHEIHIHMHIHTLPPRLKYTHTLIPFFIIMEFEIVI